ncbi:MAG: hypothetical protein M3Z23_07600, partial [Acidobacteriota bacterium]|nr:hypothetical protein [Acidobacteriota bacterium]
IDLPAVLRAAPTLDWPAVIWFERSDLTVNWQQHVFDILGEHAGPDDRYELGGVAALGCEPSCQC